MRKTIKIRSNIKVFLETDEYDDIIISVNKDGYVHVYTLGDFLDMCNWTKEAIEEMMKK